MMVESSFDIEHRRLEAVYACAENCLSEEVAKGRGEVVVSRLSPERKADLNTAKGKELQQWSKHQCVEAAGLDRELTGAHVCVRDGLLQPKPRDSSEPGGCLTSLRDSASLSGTAGPLTLLSWHDSSKPARATRSSLAAEVLAADECQEKPSLSDSSLLTC